MDLLKISDYVNYVINGMFCSFRKKMLTCGNNTMYMDKEIYKIKYSLNPSWCVVLCQFCASFNLLKVIQ